MTIIPRDVQSVSTYRLHFLGFGRFLIQGQQAGGLFGGLARIATMGVALLGAGGAGAGVAQPLETEMSAMAVVPFNVHARTGGDVDFDGLRIDYGHMHKYTGAIFP